jgi:hypothetical protein
MLMLSVLAAPLGVRLLILAADLLVEREMLGMAVGLRLVAAWVGLYVMKLKTATDKTVIASTTQQSRSDRNNNLSSIAILLYIQKATISCR